MKLFLKSVALILALTLAFGGLVGCGWSECEHADADGDGKCDECGEEYTEMRPELNESDRSECEHADADGDGKCDECGEEYTEMSPELNESEWKAAFELDNFKISITEVVFYSGQKLQETKNDYYAADGYFYNKDAVSAGAISSYAHYFPFGNSYSSFVYNGESGEYTCYSAVVNGIIYKNTAILFGEDKTVKKITFDTSNSYYEFRITVEFSDHGKTVKPEREPFVFTGEEYCEYYTERDITGHDLAYITMTVKDYGEIKLLLDATTAPITVNHILKLINEGFYDGLTFHRVIKNFMIQGGDPEATGASDYKDADGNKVTIKGEFSSNGYKGNDIKHLRGVISMARGNNMDSASCQFFICNATSSHLDGSYAAFGYVIDGMSVVDKITYDTSIYNDDGNGTIYDKSKQAVIEKIVIDELVGITLETDPGTGENELPLDTPFK